MECQSAVCGTQTVFIIVTIGVILQRKLTASCAQKPAPWAMKESKGEREKQEIKHILAKVNRSEKQRSHKRLIEMEREIQSSAQGGEEPTEQGRAETCV